LNAVHTYDLKTIYHFSYAGKQTRKGNRLAIFHFDIKVLSMGKSHYAVEKYAYRADGELLSDYFSKLYYDTRKCRVRFKNGVGIL